MFKWLLSTTSQKLFTVYKLDKKEPRAENDWCHLKHQFGTGILRPQFTDILNEEPFHRNQAIIVAVIINCPRHFHVAFVYLWTEFNQIFTVEL